MTQVIIYNQDNGIPAVFTPAPEALEQFSLADIAKRVVPAGKRFKIIDAAELPQGVAQEAWRIDEALLTDGVGGLSNEFQE
jgi:hypothetical protein